MSIMNVLSKSECEKIKCYSTLNSTGATIHQIKSCLDIIFMYNNIAKHNTKHSIEYKEALKIMNKAIIKLRNIGISQRT